MKDDLISRQAAIDAIHNLYAIHGSEGSWIDQKDAFKALNSLPSAQPTIDAVPVRHGKWIYGNDFHWYTASCSECGYQRRTDIKAEGWNQWKFCPMCGSRMDE